MRIEHASEEPPIDRSVQWSLRQPEWTWPVLERKWHFFGHDSVDHFAQLSRAPFDARWNVIGAVYMINGYSKCLRWNSDITATACVTAFTAAQADVKANSQMEMVKVRPVWPRNP